MWIRQERWSIIDPYDEPYEEMTGADTDMKGRAVSRSQVTLTVDLSAASGPSIRARIWDRLLAVFSTSAAFNRLARPDLLFRYNLP